MNRIFLIPILLIALLLPVSGCRRNADPPEKPAVAEAPVEPSTAAQPEAVDSMRLQDIKPPILPPFKYGRLLWVLLFIALVALLTGLTARLLARRINKSCTAPEIPAPPAHEIALAALARLKQSGWMEQGEAYRFYSALSQIWRQYLEGRFSINAPEKTTEELAESLRNNRAFPEKYRTMLCRCLTDADAVKFAKERPNPEMMRGSLTLCEEFILSTRETSSESGSKPEEAA